MKEAKKLSKVGEVEEKDEVVENVNVICETVRSSRLGSDWVRSLILVYV